MIQLFMSCFSAPASSSCTLCPRPVLRCPASGISGKTSCYWPGATVVSNLTLVLAIKEIGSTMTSILGSMEPLTAVLVGVLHFGEKFGLDSASGLILIITRSSSSFFSQEKEHPQTLPHESIH